MLDRLFLLISLSAVAFLIFVAGIAAYKYNIYPAPAVMDALEGGETWLTQRGAKPYTTYDNTLEVSAHARVSWDKSRAFDGYTLISMESGETALLVDMQGKVIHHWVATFLKAFPDPSHTHISSKVRVFIEKSHVFANGDLLVNYIGMGDTPYGYGLAKFDKDSNLLWSYRDNAHHDFYIDSQNRIHILTHAFIPPPVPGYPKMRNSMLSDYIATLTPEGKEIGRISILDAFIGTPYQNFLNQPPILEWDRLHTNSVMMLEAPLDAAFPMFKAGQYLISLNTLNTIAVIDPDTKKVIWAARGGWKMQHAASFQPDGNILFYDNQGYKLRGRPFSRLLEINPNTKQVVWNYSGSPEKPFFSYDRGRVQRLPNGNSLIVESHRRRIFEVTRDGDIVWDYLIPHAYVKTLKNFDPRNEQWRVLILDGVRYGKGSLPFLAESGITGKH